MLFEGGDVSRGSLPPNAERVPERNVQRVSCSDNSFGRQASARCRRTQVREQAESGCWSDFFEAGVPRSRRRGRGGDTAHKRRDQAIEQPRCCQGRARRSTTGEGRLPQSRRRVRSARGRASRGKARIAFECQGRKAAVRSQGGADRFGSAQHRRNGHPLRRSLAHNVQRGTRLFGGKGGQRGAAKASTGVWPLRTARQGIVARAAVRLTGSTPLLRSEPDRPDRPERRKWSRYLVFVKAGHASLPAASSSTAEWPRVYAEGDS